MDVLSPFEGKAGEIRLKILGWLLTAALLTGAVYLVRLQGVSESPPNLDRQSQPEAADREVLSQAFSIPAFNPVHQTVGISRIARLDTIIPNQNRDEAVPYVVEPNDSVFGIAEKFHLKPETILWSNFDELQDNPHALEPGMELLIPPTDGIYYQWQEGDTIAGVAGKFSTEPANILNFTGNELDLTKPEVAPGAYVMVPDGKRAFQQWIIPTIARGSAGVSAGVYGSGVCQGRYEGVFGSGGFIWPTHTHAISGNDYWSGHLAIDIGVGIGMPVYAADHGVVVFSGWASGGYGNVVIVDHGNGYQTLYAHLNQTSVGCGQSVYQGDVIGRGGSSGNSTGPHLHFEVRYQGGFVNPWYVLPAP